MNADGVDPRLVQIACRAIQITPIDFGIPSSGGLRTVAQQARLFANGKSKCDGYLKKSKHQSGRAIDFYAYVEGRASWNRHYLSLIATAFLQASCELCFYVQWGGLWNAWQYPDGWRDMPHIQIVG